MANLLYLVHRMPYPPNKGDKVRSYHLLMHLARQHRVFLGTFVDDPDDWAHMPALRALCADVCALPLPPRRARIRSLRGMFSGDALTLHYYADADLHDWVQRTVSEQQIDAALVFSSAMAQYTDAHPTLPLLSDLVDVDSAKWADYAVAHRFPMSWVYRREAACLLAHERAVVARSRCSFLVTENEVALLKRLAPETAGRVEAVGNGVDADYFAPGAAMPSPYRAGESPVVFTGAMDYWPNIDAVSWFVADMLPALRQRWPGLRFHIVGRNPSPAVSALASDAVVVSGTVPDVRPYLQHAAAVVAPLRLARGVQNKVLEAMAMARPVIAARQCLEAISASGDVVALSAGAAADYIEHIDRILRSPADAQGLGVAARQFVLARFGWAARLAPLDRLIPSAGSLPAHA